MLVGRYMWCSPTRRSFITGRYLTSITGEQAGTHTNLTPLQFSILPEKLKAANFESRKIVILSRFVAVRLANPKSITISGLFPFFNIGCLGCGQAHPPANWTPPVE